MRFIKSLAFVSLILFLCCITATVHAQCTALGQNPETAFPVCGSTSFEQNTVPLCSSTNLFVPGCQDDLGYANKNPFWYRFTCFVSGPLSFTITPKDLDDDYDWQLYDVTGLAANEVYTNQKIIVTGNWSGSSGATGASASGVNFIQCGSDPASNAPRFSKSPQLIAGHDYILLVSHFTDSQSGYSLDFTDGSANITDPVLPKMKTVTPDCDGKTLTLVVNKKMLCSSLSADGKQFLISPAVTTVVSAVASNCSSSFDMDEITLTLAAPLPPGDYKLRVDPSISGVVDVCQRPLPPLEEVGFKYVVPQPIFADSVGAVGCAPLSAKVFFPKRIDCRTIAPDGSDFLVTGPSPVTVIGANGNCVDGETSFITINFNSPIYHKGLYTLTLKTGVDGSTIVDECGLELPVQSLEFTAVDTVSAAFTFNSQLGCRINTLNFAHDGAHDVTTWNWLFNNTVAISQQTHSLQWPAASTNSVLLIVSNGVCSDTMSQTIVMDNQVIANFEIPDVICPEDPMQIKNTTTGLVDTWRWNYDVLATHSVKDPSPYLFPNTNHETIYNIKLTATNNTLGCSDSIRKKIKVLNNCFIAVPTAFTPNGDGKNDFLSPNNALKAENLEFSVYNRWGQLVFHTTDWTKRWDGKINGMLQSPGVFVWYLSYTNRDTKQRVKKRGTTTLIL